MWHLDNIYHGKERKDMYWCQRTLGFAFSCAEYRHALNVFKAAEDTFCSFNVLDHTKQDCLQQTDNSDLRNKIGPCSAAPF